MTARNMWFDSVPTFTTESENKFTSEDCIVDISNATSFLLLSLLLKSFYNYIL